MPSSTLWPSSLARRVRRLERSIQPNREEMWRAMLAECFAGPEYEGHREAIIAALLSDKPWYNFASEDTGAPTYFMVSWYTREQGGPAYRRVITLHDGPAVVALAPDVPQVRAYSGGWMPENE